MLIAAIIYLVFIAVLVVVGLLMLKGKAVWLISGYRTMTPEEREQYDIPALCRFVGVIHFVFAGCLAFMMLGEIFSLTPLSWIGTLAVFLAAIFAVIYANTSNHFRRH